MGTSLEKKQTAILILVRDGLIVEKMSSDEVLATNENTPRFTDTLESQ